MKKDSTAIGTASALKSTAIAVALMVGSTAAVAGPVVTEWDYKTQLTFTSADFGPGGGDVVGPPASDSELSWGYEFGDFQNPETIADGWDYFTRNRSALTIGGKYVLGESQTGGGEVTGTVRTQHFGSESVFAPDSEVGLGNSMTHWNNPISSSFSLLQGGSLFDTLSLSASGQNNYKAVTPITFDFEFKETVNFPEGNTTCAAGTPEPCGDLWGIFGIQTSDIEFMYDDNRYLISVLALDEFGNAQELPDLEVDQCHELEIYAATEENPCQGFITAEHGFTPVQFAFNIRPIPLPGAVWLFGTAIIGLAGAARFRRKA